MKKSITILLAVCLFLNLCACSSDLADGSHQVSKLEIETKPAAVELQIGRSYSVDNWCTFAYKGCQLRKQLMPAYSDYSYKFGGSDYVLSFDFEYTNTRERDIAAADFDGTFSFSDLSGMKKIVAETIDQKSMESSFIIESNETRVVHLITNVPENLQQAQLSVNFGGKEFTANFDCEVNKIIPKELSFGSKQVVSKHGEITLVDLYMDSSIYPKNPSGYYRYYEANPGKTFVIGEFKVKNLDTVAIHPNHLITGLVKADGYEFEGTCAISVDGDSSLERTRLLDPLNETTAYFLAEIPEELKTANNITLSIRFYGEDYIASMP